MTFSVVPTRDDLAVPVILADAALWLAAGALFVGVVVIVVAIAWPASRRRSRVEQIAHFGPGRTVPAPGVDRIDQNSGNVVARTALAATAAVVRPGSLENQIRQRLEQAGMRIGPQEWVLLRVCVAITGGAVFFMIFGWLGVPLGLVLGWLGSTAFRIMRRDRRTATFNERLPDALQLVVGSLKSGFSLQQALDSLVRESVDPIATEFGRAMSEYRLGVDISDALERIVVRTKSTDLEWAVMAVRIQRDVGGNLAEVLQTTVDTMRERSRLRRHVRSLSAEGRLSAAILVVLPIAIGAFMIFFRSDYMAPLVDDPLGVALVLISIVMLVLGIFWISRTIKVEI